MFSKLLGLFKKNEAEAAPVAPATDSTSAEEVATETATETEVEANEAPAEAEKTV